MTACALPIVVGVTGHRNLRPKDTEALRRAIQTELMGIRALCPNSPVALLTSLAEGADQLAAEVALSLGCRLLAALPMAPEEYRNDFSGDALTAFDALIARADSVFPVPATEEASGDPGRDFWYRQAGVYVARHSHILLALWDGRPGSPAACGTADAVDFMLHLRYDAKAGSLLKAKDDGAVIHILTPRAGEEPPAAPAGTVRWIEQVPGVFARVARETDDFNRFAARLRGGASAPLLPPDALDRAGETARRLNAAYSAADRLSLRFRNRYIAVMRALSLLGVGLVIAFLFYDELSSTLFLLFYGLLLAASFSVTILSNRRGYHTRYLEYRALAETLRVQFYLNASGIDRNVGEHLTWSQKNEIVWIKEAVSALLIGCTLPERPELAAVRRAWITEQRVYHEQKYGMLKKRLTLNARTARAMLSLSIGLYFATVLLEFLLNNAMSLPLPTGFFRELLIMRPNEELIVRNVLNILLGAVSAVTAFLANYYGKLSISRRVSDHRKMAGLYAAAEERLEDSRVPERKLFMELAREEIIENGNWLSYCRDNAPSVNL